MSALFKFWESLPPLAVSAHRAALLLGYKPTSKDGKRSISDEDAKALFSAAG